MTNESKDARRFKLEHTAGVLVSDDDILADMQRVASEFGAGLLSARLYQSQGKYSHTTAIKRFGSWNTALKAAGLRVLNEVYVSDEELFTKIEHMWIRLGRQPRKRELVRPLSRYSERPYARRFGSWRRALEAFVQWAETATDGDYESVDRVETRRRTPRDPNSALRWRVANRDSFRCQHCGKSPALQAGVQLHIDHIVPWSKGGETVFENLQTLCSECNIGKGTQHQSDG
jgi:5-methylcytosine-specific restriction endonuclease McrA